jgi:N-sulfoglucosamine sulfohydrolase
VFLSDHGMSFPFAKTNCYLNSTRTPWIVRWPDRIRPSSVDEEHFIAGIDFMPTVLDAVGVELPEGMDGTSLLPILFGGRQPGRDHVFTQFNHIHGRRPYPMRCLQNRRFGYIFNPWSDGDRVYSAEPLDGLTFEAMKKASADHPVIADRVHMLQYRVVEELYDLENDPDALHNLIDDPKYRDQADRLRGQLLEWMRATGDPALEAFEDRHSPEALERFMTRYKARVAKEIEALKAYEDQTGYHF